MHQFASGAKSSEPSLRYDLLEPAFLARVAARMAQGAASHGERNYRKGVDDPAFVRDRLNHLVGHVLALVDGRTDEDHLAAAGANLNMLAWLLAPSVPIGRAPDPEDACSCASCRRPMTQNPATITQNPVTAALDDCG
jgi:hypothetical protein